MRYNHDKAMVFEEANLAKIPVVTVDEGMAQPFGSRVAADDASGCHDALQHLIGLGHRKIAFISSDFPQLNQDVDDIGSAREAIFRQQMTEAGLEIPEGYVTRDTMLVYGENAVDNQPDSVFSATNALLDHPAGRPTAIFCWRDETAMQAVCACQRRGLRVPEEISVVGFSDISAARFFNPPLSTVKTPWEEIGRVAVTQLLARLSGEFDPSPDTHLIPTSFIARQSSGPVYRSK